MIGKNANRGLLGARRTIGGGGGGDWDTGRMIGSTGKKVHVDAWRRVSLVAANRPLFYPFLGGSPGSTCSALIVELHCSRFHWPALALEYRWTLIDPGPASMVMLLP